MQEYWEIYMKNLEGHPASVQFNAGISLELEDMRRSYPTIAFVKVTLKEPNDNGLLSESEFDEMLYLEDKLEASLIKFRIGKYVGKVVTAGSVTFIYYLQFTYNWQDFIDFALQEFGSYAVTHGHQDDSAWNYYQNLLYPNALEWQIIQNHKACDTLKAQGDALHQKRAIEHKVFFPNTDNRDAFMERLKADNFAFQEEVVNDEGILGVKFYRVDKPFYYEIDALTMELIERASAFDGVYDGWETSLVKL